MEFGGKCITTDSAPRLAEFYKIILQQDPFAEGSHYGFGKIAIWNSGDLKMATKKNIWLQCFTADIDALFRYYGYSLLDSAVGEAITIESKLTAGRING